MSRKLILAAVTATAGLFAVGCGTTPSTNPAASDAYKKAAADAAKKGEEAMKGGVEDITKKAGEGLDALKKPFEDAKGAIDKELGPIETKIGEMKKAVDAEPDAAKKAVLDTPYKAALGALDGIKNKIKDGFSMEKLKDGGMAAFTKAKDEIMGMITKLKEMLPK